MRCYLFLSVFACLFLFAARAGAEDARALLDRVIAAHGGAARLERTKRGHLKAKMEGRQGGVPFKVTWEETFDLPRRYRRTIDKTVKAATDHLEYALDGKRGWYREGTEATHDIPNVEILPLAWHWQAILAQLPLLRAGDVRLASLADETKDGRTLVGFQAASSTGAAPFYFDKTTGLLARAQWAMPSLQPGGEAAGETIYEDYRDIQGVRYPMRLKAAAGNLYSVEIALLSLEFLDTIEDAVFAKRPSPVAEKPPTSVVVEKTSQRLESARETSAEPPARWDARLIVATFAAGAIVGVVWFWVRQKAGARG